MVERTQIQSAFVKLGELLGEFCENRNAKDPTLDRLKETLDLAQQQNGWFTEASLLFSLDQWAQLLSAEKLEAWSASIPSKNTDPKTIGIIMAGNIPLVGFHDFLTVLISGNRALCKLSSNDTALLPTLATYLYQMEPRLKDRIEFAHGKLTQFDAIIGTGSNNTARCFDHYFSKYPNIIRKNRSSVAVLTGQENANQLAALGSDIFRYFGLGCRNVSKIFVPENYDFDGFFKAIYKHRAVIEHHKYCNNYDYNKAVYLMSDFAILDNGFLIVKEDSALHSPIAALFYETYTSIDALKERLQQQKEDLQCIVANDSFANALPFGQTQCPQLDDYADDVNTLNFLLGLKRNERI